MSDRDGGMHRYNNGEAHHSGHEISPRNHRKSYSRSRSHSRKYYRDDDYDGRRSGSRGRGYRSRYSRSRSRSGDYGKSGSHSPMSSRRRHLGTRDNPKPSKCLGVFGLSAHTTEGDLNDIFGKYGELKKVQVVIDAKSGRSRGFAFVYFVNTDDSKVAKEQCSGMTINGKKIRVDFSITQRPHTPTPGIYMGKPTYKYYDRYDKYRERDDYGRGGGGGGGGRYRKSPSPYYRDRRSRRYGRSRSRSYSPRRY